MTSCLGCSPNDFVGSVEHGSVLARPSAVLTGTGSEVSDVHEHRIVYAVDDFDLQSFRNVAARFGEDRFGYVVTPNVDHLVRLHDDAKFRALYDSAAYILLDSRVAAFLLAMFRGLRIPVCTGADLTATLLTEVAQPADRVILIGGSEQHARKVARAHGMLNLRHHNPPMGFINDPGAVENCLRFIEVTSPFRFCFLAVGSPQQEMIAQLLKARGRARGLALCVGASVNFMTGVEKRAPRWMQRAALEWLYRLLHNPGRLAGRYLVRGPRILAHLRKAEVVLRPAGDQPSARSTG